MNQNNLENLIYEFGHAQYRLGRMETDEKASTKEYSKVLAEKERLMKEIDLFFKNSKKVAKTLNV